MTKRDYYEVLGVDRTSDISAIKKAFRSKAREYHPDVNQSADAEDKFKEIGEAYEVLSDSDKRAMYDRYGHDGLSASGYSGFTGAFDFGDFSDILSSFFGGMGGTRSSSQNPNAPMRGSDLRLDLEIDFMDAVFGAKKDVEIEHLEICSTCSGKGSKPGSSPIKCQKCGGIGQIQQTTRMIIGTFTQVTTCPDCGGQGQRITDPCKDCAGHGRKQVSKIINITIPAGVDSGTKMRVSSEGDAGRNNGPSGDLYIMLYVKNHDYFKREGLNIFVDQSISFTQAALGGIIEIKTLDGVEKIKVSAGTQSATVMTLKGLGVPYLNNPKHRGEFYIRLNVTTPTNLNEEQKKLLKRLEEIDVEKASKQNSLLDKFKDAFTGSGH